MANGSSKSGALIGLLTGLATLLILMIILELHQSPSVDHTAVSSVQFEGSRPEAETGREAPPVHPASFSDNQPRQFATEGRSGGEDSPFQWSSHPFPAEEPSAQSHRTDDEPFMSPGHLSDDEAIRLLQLRIQNHPEDVNAHHLLADKYYQSDKLTQAISIWEDILRMEPLNRSARTRLAKAQREIQAHERFTQEVTRHFRIRFEGAENRDLYKTVLDLLEEAYSEVGKTLSFYPGQEIIVFLYTNEQFFDVTRAPAWTGGIFDGKIRIPTGGYQAHVDRLRRVLFHEYVHAAIHQMAENASVHTAHRADLGVPTWLHEGIAQYLEPGTGEEGLEDRLNTRKKSGLFIPLSKLHGSFMGFQSALAGLAYDESFSAVIFLVRKFGTYGLQKLLTQLAEGKDMDQAMRDSLFISYQDFQTRWEDHLRS